jgi:hypothetical protein
VKALLMYPEFTGCPSIASFLISDCSMEREKYSFSFKTQHERRITMPLIQLVIVLVVVGVVLWVINSYIPMQSTIKKILNVVVIIAVILWLLSVFGLIGNLSAIRIGK